jgi:3'-5' exoribonuclease
LIHDVGKTRELELGPPIEYSDEGRLIGHVILGVRILDETLAKLNDFPEDLADALRHMILSHHGEYEFGSPKRPKTAEAMALHFADDLDAKLAMFRNAAQENCGQTWSPFNRLLGRYLYVGPSPAGQTTEDTEAECVEPEPGPFGLFDRSVNGEEY